MRRKSGAVSCALVLMLALALVPCTAFAEAGSGAGSEEYLSPGVFSIDGTYYAPDMNAPYMDGYSPTVADGRLVVTLPLLADQPIDGNIIYCDLDLGDTASSPFAYTNYDSIPIGPLHPDPADEAYNPLLFVPTFRLPLSAHRVNGVYPLGVSIRFRCGGRDRSQQFKIDFTVSDGLAEPEPSASDEPSSPGDDDPGYGGGGASGGDGGWGGGDDGSLGGGSGGGSGAAEDSSEPKVILEHYVASPSPCPAGSPFTVTCTLRNTSKKVAVKNMTVTYRGQGADLIADGGASTKYIESIAKNGTVQFAFTMRAVETAVSGPQKIDLALAYEGPNGSSYTASDEITVIVQQKIRLEYDRPNFPVSVYLGDTMNASLNLYNKGKGTLYNVTVELDVPGITPESSAFLGNLESGGSKTADIYAEVTGLDDSWTDDSVSGLDELFPEADGQTVYGIGETVAKAASVDAAADEYDEEYGGAGMLGAGAGPTEGNFIISYEDEFGDNYTELVPVETEILPQEFPGDDPGGFEEPEQPEEEGFPWWGWALIGGGGAGAAGAAAVRAKRKKRAAELEADADDDELS